jgi:hypothetical protein
MICRYYADAVTANSATGAVHPITDILTDVLVTDMVHARPRGAARPKAHAESL